MCTMGSFILIQQQDTDAIPAGLRNKPYIVGLLLKHMLLLLIAIAIEAYAIAGFLRCSQRYFFCNPFGTKHGKGM